MGWAKCQSAIGFGLFVDIIEVVHIFFILLAKHNVTLNPMEIKMKMQALMTFRGRG